MKTTLVLLIAGLFLLATPMLALSQGKNRHKDGAEYSRSWKNDRHDHDRGHRYGHDHKWERRAKRHWRKHRRAHRREHRRHYRPYYADRVVVAGPQIVFRIDW